MIYRNLTSQIPFGYISAQALDSDIVNELQLRGTDPYYDAAVAEAQREQAHQVDEGEVGEWLGQHHGLHYESLDEDSQRDWKLRYVEEHWDSKYEDTFNDAYQPDEPVHEGIYQGVKYSTSWLGGALNVWVFESPHITNLARQASPCVPGAAILDTLDGNVTGYDVPPSWRRDVP
jgi:hypothetical protein